LASEGLTVVILEVIMTVTDPPVKLLRRLIPQLTIGAVRFDLSIMVLLLVAFIGMQLAVRRRGLRTGLPGPSLAIAPVVTRVCRAHIHPRNSVE
jgi:hypothetical protein